MPVGPGQIVAALRLALANNIIRTAVYLTYPGMCFHIKALSLRIDIRIHPAHTSSARGDSSR